MDTLKRFEIPVVLFIFKRSEKAALIVDQIAKIKPTKIYLIGDGPRCDEEREAVEACRANIEKHITWDCKIIRNYAQWNRGVFENIAGGANWVFEQEEKAIFLEDDNYPALSFFHYCEDLLDKYNNDTRVVWICGTNYMGRTEPSDGSDYYFTQLMLPCGWASWAHKFPKFYDGHMDLYRQPYIKQQIRNQYKNKLLYKHDYPSWDKILKDLDNGLKPVSWDYQMAFSLRVNNLFGIAPKYNQIMNIGADTESIHGGISMDNIMTARFCEVPIYELKFPLHHPESLMVDEIFETQTEKKIILPLKYRMKAKLVKALKKIAGIDQEQSIRTLFHKK